jgi:hypothetical protein
VVVIVFFIMILFIFLTRIVVDCTGYTDFLTRIVIDYTDYKDFLPRIRIGGTNFLSDTRLPDYRKPATQITRNQNNP